MPDIKFSQLPDLPNPTPSTIIPVVESGVNYTVTANTLQGFVNSTTGNVTAGNIVTSGQVTATGNITGNYFIGNGSQLTGITGTGTYGNANVVTLLSAFGSNTVSTTGTITAGNFVGTIQQATVANLVNISNANSGSSSSFYVAFAADAGNNAVNIDDAGDGLSYIPGQGKLDLTAIEASGQILANSVVAQTTISATGNITGSYFIGNGSLLTGISSSSYGNANVAAYLPTYTGAITASSVSATGNITGAFIKGNGSQLTGIVTSIVAGNGISVNSSTGSVTITATGSGGGNASGKIASSVTTGAYGTTSETISASVLIPAGTFTTNDTLEIFAQWLNNNVDGVQRFANIYVSPTNSIPSNSLQIWGGITAANPNYFTKNWLRLEIINGTNNTRSFFAPGGVSSVSNTQVTALGQQNTFYTVSINWGVNQYIIFTGRNANAAGGSGLANAGYQIYKG